MLTAARLCESSWLAACGSSSPSCAQFSCIRPRTHSLTCTQEGFSLGANPLWFPRETSGTEQRRTRLAGANSDWERELGATGPVLEAFQARLHHPRPHLRSTHHPGFHRRFHRKDLREPVAVRCLGRRLDWRHAERDRNHPNRLTRQHNELNVARCLSTSRLRRWGNLTRQCEKEKGGLALSEGMGCTLTN